MPICVFKDELRPTSSSALSEVDQNVGLEGYGTKVAREPIKVMVKS